MKKIALILFLSIILFSLSCATTSQNSTSQDLEVKSVEPFTPTNEILDVNSISPELIEKSENSTRFLDANETITKINGEITDEIMLQGRDLSIYDKSDTSNCHSPDCRQRKLREFIWQHWKNKKLGYISSSIMGIDVKITEHIFIEQNKRDEWIVIWKTASSHAMLGNSIIETLGIIFVKKINSKESGYKLELKNIGGETLQRL